LLKFGGIKSQSMATVYLVGEIGKEVTAETVAADLATIPKNQPLIVVLDSIGGSVSEAQNIADLLAEYPNRQIVIKKAYSIASWLCLQFPKNDRSVHIEADDDFFMIHMPVFAAEQGDTLSADEMRKYAEQLDGVAEMLADTYSNELGISTDEAKKLMLAETYISPAENKKYQLAAVGKSLTNQTQTMSLAKKLSSLLDEFSGKIKAVGEEVPVEMTPEDMKAKIIKLEEALATLQAERDQLKSSYDEMAAKMTATMDEEVTEEMEAKLVAVLSKAEEAERSNAKLAKEVEDLKKQNQILARGAAKKENAPELPAGSGSRFDERYKDNNSTWAKHARKLMQTVTVFVLMLVSGLAMAQVTQNQTPRFGTKLNQPASGLQYGYISFTQATGVDTIAINPNAQITFVNRAVSSGAQTALNDSVAFKFTLPAQRRWCVGDIVIIGLLADGTARKVKYVGAAVSSSTTTITANKWYHRQLIFTGTLWVPLSAGIIAP
jgi:ATP-dependent protease ClpP protease subunit